MATGKVENDSEWEQIQEEITCSICGDLFSDPKTIPCLHTFCKECLEKSIDTNKNMAIAICCPLCRAPLPEGELDVPTNFRIKRFIEIFTKRLSLEADSLEHSIETVHGCGKCEEDLPAVTWCVECQVSLCHGCDEIHKKWKEFKLHKTVAVEEYLQNSKKFSLKRQELKKFSTTHDQYVDSSPSRNPSLQSKADLKAIDSCRDQAGSKKKMPQHANKQILEKMKLSKAYKIDKSMAKFPKGNKSIQDRQLVSQKEPANYPLFEAKYDYFSKVDSVFSFKEGDLFYVIDNKEDWWYAQAKDSGDKGYIPGNYFAKFRDLDSYAQE